MSLHNLFDKLRRAEMPAGPYFVFDVVAVGCLFGWHSTTPTDGTSGTGANIAATGCLLTDYTNGKVYINTNTLASPLWTVVGAQTT